MHESGDFKYDGEIWGPTPAQKRYDTRVDLGNTPAVDGDGFLYRGRTAMQLTGKSNYRQFRDWCRARGFNPPDFVSRPDMVTTDPWEGLVPLWYWTTRDLSKWVDQGDIETITRKINGGKNGLPDRIDRYGQVALVLLGYKPDNVLQFQADHVEAVSGPDGVDNDVGPKTRAALHQALGALIPGEMAKPSVQVAPIVEEKTITEHKPVVPVSVDSQVKTKADRTGWFVGIGGTVGTALTAVLGSNWQTILAFGGVSLVALLLIVLLRRQIVAAVKEIRGEVEA